MINSCRQCRGVFERCRTEQDFLAKLSVPSPTLCPNCRQQRRAAFRNERNLYRRTCDFSGRSIISTYSPDKPFKVYDTEMWWSDKWDPLAYGRPFIADVPFFEQFRRLMLEVPRPALFNKGSENSAYTNHAVYNKNCYLCFNTGYCQDAYYCDCAVVKCTDCADLTSVMESELLYNCVNCERCYNSAYLVRSRGCSDSRYLFDCRGCSNCFMCWNLRNRSYCIENEQLSQSEYFDKAAMLSRPSATQEHVNLRRFEEIIGRCAVHPALITEAVEGEADGDYIAHSKNIAASFDVKDSEDLRYCYDAWRIKDCMDTFQTADGAELQYETHASSVSFNAKFCNISHENRDIEYADHCFNSADLFGCVALRHNRYCILNTQYSSDEYFALKDRIVQRMKQAGEYGEFFPAALSPYGYNETLAQQYFPLSPREAAEYGFNWSCYDAPSQSDLPTMDAALLPDDLEDAEDELTAKVLSCSVTKKLFRISPQELALYRKLKVALPTVHPDLRYARRLKFRNRRRLAPVHCASCKRMVQTSCDTSATKRIYCPSCYLQAVRE